MHDEIVFEFPEEICVQKRVAIRKLNEKIDAESKKSQKFANAQKNIQMLMLTKQI